MPWNRSRMWLLTAQTDIDAAVEKYGMSLLQERTAAAANEEAANNDDAHANNANDNAINADTHANVSTSLEANTN
jgi:hypothetical protein